MILYRECANYNVLRVLELALISLTVMVVPTKDGEFVPYTSFSWIQNDAISHISTVIYHTMLYDINTIFITREIMLGNFKLNQWLRRFNTMAY